MKSGVIVWGRFVINSAGNNAYRPFPRRSAACWETDQEEVRMKLDEANHSVSIVIAAPTNTSSIQSHQFAIFVVLFRTRQKEGGSSTATT